MNIPKKVRGFIIDKFTGKPLQGISVSLIGEPDDRIELLLGVLSSDTSGYVSFDLSPLLKIRNNLTRLWITALDDEKNIINIPNRYPDNIQNIIGFQFLLKVDKKKCTCNVNLPSVQNVDIYDWQLSPYSFSIKPGLILGEGCCETPTPSHIAERDFRFYKVVRRFNKADGEDIIDFRAGREIARSISPVNASTPHNTNVDALPIGYGEVLEFRQQWFPLGHSLGQVVYSLPLAPCESVNIAVIDWSRQDTTVRTDDVKVTEALRHRQTRDRTIEETIDAALDESQGGWSILGGQSSGASGGGSLSASGTVPVEGVPINLAGTGSGSIAALLGIGGSISNTWGDRDLTGSSLQELHDTITQATSVTRTLNSTVVIQATQAEQNVVQTRTITNHNHCHALTIQYYEVLRNFKIVTEFVQRKPVVLLPYALFEFNWELALRFRPVLEHVLIDKKLSVCFAAINRLHFCAEIYKVEEKPQDKKTNSTTNSQNFFEGRFNTTVPSSDVVVTGLNIQKGSIVHISTPSKGIKFGFDLGAGYNADGEYKSAGKDYPAPSLRYLSLIAKIGNEWYQAGVDETFEAKDQGSLVLRANDYKLDDNSGSYDVTIEVTRPKDSSTGSIPPITDETPKKQLTKIDDECCETKLLKHLNYNLAYYNRAIWLLQDAAERRMQLEKSLQSLPNILNGLSDWPLAVSGNYIAFAYDDPSIKNDEIANKKKEDQKKYNVIEPRIVSLPTRGLFAEAQLGNCNSCEVRDVTRFWKWEESPCEKPPAIGDITPGPKGQAPATPQPASLPNPIVNVLQAPSAPDPVGLAAALKLMETPNIFRDMSGLEEVSQLLNTLANGTVSSMQEAQKIAQQAQNKLKAEQTKTAIGTNASNPSQSPEQRYDNLQVAKQATQAAKDLGVSPEGQEKIFDDVLGVEGSTPDITYTSSSSTGVGDAIYFADLIDYKPEPQQLLDIKPRGLELQNIKDGIGDVNLDLYTLEITNLPINPANGAKFTEEELFNYIRKELATLLPKFRNYPGPPFEPYEQVDKANWEQFSPVGAVMQFNIDANPVPPLTNFPVPEWGLVLCSELVKNNAISHFQWRFVTLHGPMPYGYHPVSGTREFGLSKKGQNLMFYIRAADRVTMTMDYPASALVFSGAESFWKGFFAKLTSFIQNNQGATEMLPYIYSKRHPWSLVNKLIHPSSTPI